MVMKTDYSATLEEIYYYLHGLYPEAVIKRNAFTTKTPNKATAIAQYGFSDDVETGVQLVRVQVMARALKSSEARVQAQTLSLAITKMRGPYKASVDADAIEYIEARRLSGPIYIKDDDANRSYYAANIEIKKQGFSPATIT